LNPASAFPAACGGVSEHKKNRQKRIEDSSQLAARSFNIFNCGISSKNIPIFISPVEFVYSCYLG